MGMSCFSAMGWKGWSLLWSRAGLLFSDFSSAVLSVQSGAPDWEGSQSKGGFGQQAMGGLCMIPEPGEEVGGGGSCLFKTLHSPPTPVLPTPMPPRALCA